MSTFRPFHADLGATAVATKEDTSKFERRYWNSQIDEIRIQLYECTKEMKETGSASFLSEKTEESETEQEAEEIDDSPDRSTAGSGSASSGEDDTLGSENEKLSLRDENCRIATSILQVKLQFLAKMSRRVERLQHMAAMCTLVELGEYREVALKREAKREAQEEARSLAFQQRIRYRQASVISAHPARFCSCTGTGSMIMSSRKSNVLRKII